MRTAVAERELPAPQLGDPVLGLQQQLGREVPERDHHRGLDERELGLEVGPAGLDLDRLRIPVARRAALHHVRDVDVGPGQADPLDQQGEELAGPADERLALADPPARPGPSPTNSSSAWGSPTPKTTWVRVAASPHAVQPSAVSRSDVERGELGGVERE